MVNAPSPSMRDLARRLLAEEAVVRTGENKHVHEAVRVCEKLRISLTRFAGPDGFSSLLRRALALARTQVPTLKDIQTTPNGSLENLATLPDANEAAVAILAHLLDLLVTLIGQPLTMRLLKEAWPDTPWNK